MNLSDVLIPGKRNVLPESTDDIENDVRPLEDTDALLRMEGGLRAPSLEGKSVHDGVGREEAELVRERKREAERSVRVRWRSGAAYDRRVCTGDFWF